MAQKVVLKVFKIRRTNVRKEALGLQGGTAE